MKESIELIKSLNISDNDYIIVACSGGPDSMLLLYVLNSLNYKCVCAHVNHNLREESKEEYEYVEKYCKDNNIIFEGTELHDLPKVNTELRAREKRYEFFKKLVKKYNAKYVFTAHHGDDLIETILLRLVRGSTLNGYAGFNIITDKKDYKIVRPLVYMTKDDIESYLKEKNIKYYIDATNMTDEHLRNRYRKNVLPILKEEYKNVHLKFLKFHEEAQGYYDFVNKLVYQYMDDMFVDNTLDINKFNKLDDFIKDKLLREVIRIYYPDDLYLIDDNHINEILKMINSNKPNIDLVLPNITITKKYDKLLFNNIKLSNNSYKYELVDKVDTPLGVIKLIDKDDNDTSNNIIRLNSKDIKLPLIVRTRENGDKIHVKNMNGSKKVNDIFIDSKIENDKRDIYPVIIDSNGTVIFIPGLKKSKFDIAINGDYDIIVKYEKGEKNDEEKE